MIKLAVFKKENLAQIHLKILSVVIDARMLEYIQECANTGAKRIKYEYSQSPLVFILV